MRSLDQWIKFRKKLLSDPRVAGVAYKTKQKPVAIIGGLVWLWCLADDHLDEKKSLGDYKPKVINAIIGIKNFLESLPEDWCRIDGETIYLPDYLEHNGATAKQRACGAATTRKWRDRQTDVNGKPFQSKSKSKRESQSQSNNQNHPDFGRRAAASPPATVASQPAAPPQKNSFAKPTVAEVAAYCRERGNNVNPQRFIDHYESNGWKVGKNPMKDWQAAVRTWEGNSFDGGAPKDDLFGGLQDLAAKAAAAGTLHKEYKS